MYKWRKKFWQSSSFWRCAWRCSQRQFLLPGGGIAGLQGDGSPNNPYLISNKDELQKFRNAVNGGQNQICGKLTDDIGIVTFKDSLPSIGTANYPYMGTFDGNGYSYRPMYTTARQTPAYLVVSAQAARYRILQLRRTSVVREAVAWHIPMPERLSAAQFIAGTQQP